MQTVINSRQQLREHKDYQSATTKEKERVIRLMDDGREYELAYGKEIVSEIFPFIAQEIMKLKGPAGNSVEMWKRWIKPTVMKAEKPKEVIEELVAMVAFILTSKLSDMLPLPVLARRMMEAFVDLYTIQPDELSDESIDSIISYFQNVVTRVADESGIFEVKREDHYLVKPVGKWEALVEKGVEDALNVEGMRYRPLVAEPIPHTDLISGFGGFHQTPSPLFKHPLKLNGSVHPVIKNCTAENQPELFKTLNADQSTKMCLNGKLWNVMDSFRRRGMHFDGFAFKFEQCKPKYEESAKILIEEKSDARLFWATENGEEFKPLTESQRKAIYREEMKKAKAEARQTTMLMKTVSEDQYEEFICFAKFLDKRNRNYVYASSVSYQGDELNKAFIQLYDKKPLNRTGIKNLFIALGNALGFDKRIKTVRLAMAKTWWNDNVEEFKKGNFDIFINEQHSFDEPINALAITLELCEFIKDHDYLCGYPLHNDARCSGPSLIGTVSNDIDLMRITSVVEDEEFDGDLLPDAYTITMKLALKKAEEDAQSDEVIQKLLTVKDKLFSRKAFKNPTMTRISYGAKPNTIRRKVAELFMEHRLTAELGFTKVHKQKFFELMIYALDNALPTCKKWLNLMEEVAEDVIKNNDGVIAFTNPITGMGCAWKYVKREEKKLKVRTKMRTFETVIYKDTNIVNEIKTKNSMAANITHHLDGSVLIMVRQLFSKPMITIHDSLACHPNEVDELRHCYNKVMVILNRMDVVNKILSQFCNVKLERVSEEVIPMKKILQSIHSIS